jgi:6-phosphogluconolactonase
MWNVYFGDERCLPVDDPARNSRMAGEAWLDHVFIPTVQFHAIPPELGAVRDIPARAITPVAGVDVLLESALLQPLKA